MCHCDKQTKGGGKRGLEGGKEREREIVYEERAKDKSAEFA